MVVPQFNFDKTALTNYEQLLFSLVLIKAKVLIREGWCQRGSARDAYYTVVPYGSEKAIYFDTQGAISKAIDTIMLPNTTKYKAYILSYIQDALKSVIKTSNIDGWNDASTMFAYKVINILDSIIKPTFQLS